MTDATRLELELADALGVTQAVRHAAARVHEHAPSDKLRKRLERLNADLADLQERTNALVVEDVRKRTRLTRRSRVLRDAEDGAVDGRTAEGEQADALDAAQALAAECAYALAQWQVVRRLSKAEGRKGVRRLAKEAQPLALEHFELALDVVDRLAKREAKALGAA